MERTVCELFAGVGGFRCGLNHIKNIADIKRSEKWKTVWFNQWEPSEKSTQWAHSCYINHFGQSLDLNNEDTTNIDIHLVNKDKIPDHSLLVGGFPCQDYSVANTLSSSKGIEGKKGVLWWDIREILEVKKPPFVLLENVDRLLKSPAKMRGRDFAIILACFRDLQYNVEWRVINAADYGLQQRRRRVFIFAYKTSTKYNNQIINSCNNKSTEQFRKILISKGFFAKTFPVEDNKDIKNFQFNQNIGEISKNFKFDFENSGILHNNEIFTIKTTPDYDGAKVSLGDLLEESNVDKSLFIPREKLYYTNPKVCSCDESSERLPLIQRKTWQYIKGGKHYPRTTKEGYTYMYSEGPIPMLDEYEKPARTLLTSEGSFNRSTHLVKDKLTGRIRLLTPTETERIQGFPSDWTKECLVNNSIKEMPTSKRRFMMGNALVVNLIEMMEPKLTRIIHNEE